MVKGKAIESKVDAARLKLIKEIPLNKYLIDHKYLYIDAMEGKINCPVHEERSPSCFFDAEKGVYHCFGCGSKGSLVEMETAMDKKTDDKANTIKTILKLSKEYNIAIPNMFEYDTLSKPRKHKRDKFDLKKQTSKNEDTLYTRKLERLEESISQLSITDRLKAYRVIDNVFLDNIKPKDAYEKLDTFVNSKIKEVEV